MKKILAVLTIAAGLATTSAHAHGQGSPWIPFGVGVIIGNVLTQRPTYVYQLPPPPMAAYPVPQTVYVYPSDAPVIPMPGQVCELRSENINGQVVTGNFCYHR